MSNPKLGNYRRKFTDQVSVIIHVNESEAEAAALLDSIAQQDYENIEVLIQRSGTEQLAAQATGDYFLFLDPDTLLKNGFIHSLVYRTKIFDLTILSIVPTQQLSGFLTWCTYPLNDFVLLNLFPLRLVKLVGHPVFSAANEACLFFEAKSYRKYEWHQQLKGTSSPGVEIVRMVKQEQLKADLLLGNKLIYIKEQPTSVNMRAFSKRMMLNFNNYPIIALFYLLLVVVGPIVIMIEFEFEPAFLVLPFGLIFLARIMTSFLSAQHPILNILFHPLQLLTLFAIVISNSWARLWSSVKHKK